MSGSRKRVVWTVAALAVLLLLSVLPPLVNANRYGHQVARSIGASLGRPVHLDTVSLHLLPVPGLTLSNFVVSEDPKFGAEPTIRADTVEATLRLSSLWRRPIEFSTVRFVEPHVNLVRDPEGRWNLADVLLHAAHVQAAPTVQAHPGPAPRFPYIEASGARVNIKFGAEKVPFSITDADFALWLPSPNQWRIRLQGQPTRTDTDLNDPGTLRLDGNLERAETATGIPVNLHATWHDAPLGEASRLVLGDDMGWRGTLNADATLAGTLSGAKLQSKLTLGGLRRADFAAQQPLDLQITCGGGLSAAAATVSQLRCTMPDDAPLPMLLEAESVDFNRLPSTGLTLTAEDIPLHWGLLWAALFSVRVPTTLEPRGRIDIHLQHLASVSSEAPPVVRVRRSQSRLRAEVSSAAPAPWTGEVRVKLPSAPVPAFSGAAEGVNGEPEHGTELVWKPTLVPPVAREIVGERKSYGFGLSLQPMTIPLEGGGGLAVTAALTPEHYTVAVNGTASAAALLLPARYLPQLGDGLEDILPFPPTGADDVRVDFTCDHPWGASQTCTNLRPAASRNRAPGPYSAGAPQPPVPALLAPRSLSPYDRNPPLGVTSAPLSASPHR